MYVSIKQIYSNDNSTLDYIVIYLFIKQWKRYKNVAHVYMKQYHGLIQLSGTQCNDNTILSNYDVYGWRMFQLLLGGDTIEHSNLPQVSDNLYCIKLYPMQLVTFWDDTTKQSWQ
jgi:hypothetical protein